MLKKHKVYSVLLLLLCITVNLGGKQLSNMLELPIWFDSCGTALSAYAFGPVIGAATGLASNAIFGFAFDMNMLYYSLTSVAIGCIIGMSAKKKHFDSLFETISVSVFLTLVGVILSVPINYMILEGKTGNTWGNGVIEYLSERNVPTVICRIMGQFYVEFVDKVLLLVGLHGVIRTIRKIKKVKNKDSEDEGGSAVKAASLLAALVMTASLLQAVPVRAEEVTEDEQTTVTAAQTSEYDSYIQTLYSKAEGLECGEANDIAQTEDGVLWIGSYAGLYRYAGKEFTMSKEYSTVKNVNRLYVDNEDRLWIGTNDNGLAVAKDEKVVATLDEKGGLSSSSVRSISRTDDGLYYVGTAGTLMILEMDRNNNITVAGEIKEIGTGDCVVSHGERAACVNSGGAIYLMKDKKITDSIFPESEEAADFASCNFVDDMLYAGMSDNTIRVYDVSSDKLVEKEVLSIGDLSFVNSIEQSGDKVFVCADNGVGYFDAKGDFYKINTNAFNNSIDNFQIDYQGNLWFTSSRLGLLKLSKSVFTDIFTTYGIPSAVVNAVERSDGKLYFGTDNGLTILDESTSKTVQNELTEALDGVRVRCVKTDKAGNLWVSSYGKGLVACTPEGEIKIFDSAAGASGNWARVTVMMQDGTVASASDTGISFIKDLEITNTIIYGDDFTSSAVLCLLEDDKGQLWAGSDGEGIYILENGKVTDHLTRENGLTSGVILRLTKCSEGGYIAVTSNGLCYIDNDHNITALSNFPYSNNFDICEDGNGKLFVLGSAGIYVVDEKSLLENKKDITFDKLDAKRGLTASITANSWNYSDEDGKVYLSCDTGAFMFDMNNYINNAELFKMKLSHIKTDKKVLTIDNGTDISIARNVKKLELYPEVINYSIEDPTISYQLEGFDPEPTVLSNSDLDRITYTNLPVGEYTFSLKVMDSGGNAVEEMRIKLTKQKEIYDRAYFTVYMLSVAALAIMWLTWYIAKKQTQKVLDRQRAQLELAEKQVQMGNETIMAIAKTVDAKDGNTSRHSFRVSEYAVMMAKELGWSHQECENLRKAALLHDIGKIGIPDSVLNKPSRLTDEEYKVMKTHVTRGAEILKDFTLVDHVVEGALYHHERYDGSGYNSGLKGEEIPVYGRIIGVADAFDAMTANRVYRKQLDMGYVRNEFAEGRGKQFDPQMVDVLLKLIDNGTIDVEKLYNKKED
ncbi:MAG: HD domain-containing protein [Ruminococcus sp.]|nr:HD domain-containing protein [Ruminococcus sp.]